MQTVLKIFHQRAAIAVVSLKQSDCRIFANSLNGQCNCALAIMDICTRCDDSQGETRLNLRPDAFLYPWFSFRRRRPLLNGVVRCVCFGCLRPQLSAALIFFAYPLQQNSIPGSDDQKILLKSTCGKIHIRCAIWENHWEGVSIGSPFWSRKTRH